MSSYKLPETTIGDFLPFTIWKEVKPSLWKRALGHDFTLVDAVTKKQYQHWPLSGVWCNCLRLCVGTIPVQTVMVIDSSIHATRRIFSGDYGPRASGAVARKCLPFLPSVLFTPLDLIDRMCGLGKKGWHLKERMKDLVHIILSPLTVAALQLSALYGLVSPRTGSKIYAAIERLQYGTELYSKTRGYYWERMACPILQPRLVDTNAPTNALEKFFTPNFGFIPRDTISFFFPPEVPSMNYLTLADPTI